MDNEMQTTAHYWISTGEDEPGGYIGGCYETIADAETAAEELGAYFQFTEPDGRHHSFGLDRGLFVRRCRATCTSCHDCTGDAPHEHAPTCDLALGGLETALNTWAGLTSENVIPPDATYSDASRIAGATVDALGKLEQPAAYIRIFSYGWKVADVERYDSTRSGHENLAPELRTVDTFSDFWVGSSETLTEEIHAAIRSGKIPANAEPFARYLVLSPHGVAVRQNMMIQNQELADRIRGLETAPPWGGGNGNPRMDPKDCV